MTPIFAYRCHHCGVRAEVHRPIDDALMPIQCPECGTLALGRDWSPSVLERSEPITPKGDVKR